MARSLIYSNRFVYRSVMQLLYRGNFEERYAALDREVMPRCSVLELCFGDLYLYEHYLSKKKISYMGIEFNPTFVQYAVAKKLHVIEGDIKKVAYPSVDVVIMQASLYQFIDNALKILQKMWKSTKKKMIVAEPVRNLAQSSNRLVSFLAKRFVNAGQGDHAHRYDAFLLQELFDEFYRMNVSSIASITYKKIKGGRELVVCITKR